MAAEEGGGKRPPDLTYPALKRVPVKINHEAPVQAAAEAEIPAPIDLVWRVQSEIPRWPEWNPDVGAAEILGPLSPGTTFKWKAGGMRIISELRVVDPPRSLGWTGRTLGIRAVHIWSFDETESGTRVRTEESFEGWLAKLIPGTLRRALAASLEKGLEALSAECRRRQELEGG